MIAFLLLLAAEPDIVVVGRRFDEAHGVIKRNVLTGKLQCTITETSGSAVIDKGVCDVGLSCMRSTKKAKAFEVCMADGRQRFLDDYFNAREAAHAAE